MWQKISKTIIAKFDNIFLLFLGCILAKVCTKELVLSRILSIKLETFKTTKLKGKTNKQTNLGLDFSDIHTLPIHTMQIY
jgi:hypothetical protein